MTEFELGDALRNALEPLVDNLKNIGEKLKPFNESMAKTADALNEWTRANVKAPERCMNCAHCFDLAEVDPMRPYSGTGDGSFYCMEFDMEFYAPNYSAEAFYCGDFTLKPEGFRGGKKPEQEIDVEAEVDRVVREMLGKA